MLVTQGTRSELRVETLDSRDGFTELHTGTTLLVSRYDYIIHMIDLEDVEMIVEQFRHNLNIIGQSPHQIIAKSQLEEMEDAVHTLLPRRKPRGLVNAGGALMRFVFGTMDEDDRQNVEEHQRILTENNHQLIEGLNQQILINDGFNRSLHTLRAAILTDRQEIEGRLNNVNEMNKRLVKENLAILQLSKINILKRRLEGLQQTVASARLGIFLPSLLTKAEIEKFEIDVEKLKDIRIGIVTSQRRAISLLIKIPAEKISGKISMIVPVPNKEKLQIDEDIETMFRAGDQALTYLKGKAFFELRKTRNCIIRQPCRMIRNARQDIIQMDDSKIVAINMKSTRMKSTCDGRTFNLTGHYYIQFNNCTILLGATTLKNSITRYEHSFAVPPKEVKPNTVKPIIFEDLALSQESNLKKIEELHFHKVVVTTMGSITLTVLVILVITVVILCKRQGKVQVKITENKITKGAARSSTIRRNLAAQETGWKPTTQEASC